MRERLASGEAPGRYQVLAAINAVQTDGTAYDRAIALAGNSAESAYLTRRRDELGPA